MTRPPVNLFTSKITLKTWKNPAERSKCIIIITVIRTRLCWWLIECWDCDSLRMRCEMSGDVILARTGVRLTGARHRTTGGTNTLSRHGLHRQTGGARPGLICITLVLWHYRGAFRVRSIFSILIITATGPIIESHVTCGLLRHSGPLSAP